DENTPEIDKTITIYYQNIEEESIVEDAFKLTNTIANLEQPHQEAINSHSMASSKPAADQADDFLCERCNLKFSGTRQLLTHLKTHSEKKRYTCEHVGCNCSFTRLRDKNEHILRKHEKIKPFKCPYADCGRSFFNLKQQKSHFLTHTRERNHMCSYCYRAFSHSSSMLRHIQTQHTSNKYFKCQYCNCLFSKYLDKQLHIERDHKMKSSFPCADCGKKFRSPSSRSEHIRKFHPSNKLHKESDVIQN
ncbi:MAG: C2H2-type zinc finger protein, partial [Endozoicomonas sp. (ex Botrylloides leachii)]|nr:C2H2-type zinc finger protein [Endozoicomonas sp. (ex Botrylloides leachii)]